MTWQARRFLLIEKDIVIFIVLFSLYWWTIPLQTQDGPNHKKVAVTLDRLPYSPVENAVYRSNMGPFQTNELFPLVYTHVSKFVSIDTYEKLFTGFFLVLLAVSYRYFLSVWSPGSVSLWVVVLPLLFFRIFMIGMYNFLASVPLTFIALGLLRKGVESKQIGWLPLFFVSSYLVYLAHPFPFFLLPVCGFIMGVQQWRKSWPHLCIYGLIVFVFMLLAVVLPGLYPLNNVEGDPFRFHTFPELIENLFNGTFIVFSVPHIFFVIPYFAFLLLLALYSWRTVEWKHKVYWVACLCLFALFPARGHCVAYLSQRFLLFLWCLLPLGISLQKRAVRLVQALCVMTAVAHGAMVGVGMSKVSEVVRDVKDVLESLPSYSRLYTMNFDTKGPALNSRTLFHIWAVYDHSKIIFSPNLFAHTRIMPLSRLYRSTPFYFPSLPEVFPENTAKIKGVEREDMVDTWAFVKREESFQKIIATAAYYDYWLVLSPPPDFMMLLKSTPGLKKVSEKGNISLWHFEKAKSFIPPLPKPY